MWVDILNFKNTATKNFLTVENVSIIGELLASQFGLQFIPTISCNIDVSTNIIIAKPTLSPKQLQVTEINKYWSRTMKTDLGKLHMFLTMKCWDEAKFLLCHQSKTAYHLTGKPKTKSVDQTLSSCITFLQYSKMTAGAHLHNKDMEITSSWHITSENCPKLAKYSVLCSSFPSWFTLCANFNGCLDWSAESKCHHCREQTAFQLST